MKSSLWWSCVPVVIASGTLAALFTSCLKPEQADGPYGSRAGGADGSARDSGSGADDSAFGSADSGQTGGDIAGSGGVSGSGGSSNTGTGGNLMTGTGGRTGTGGSSNQPDGRMMSTDSWLPSGLNMDVPVGAFPGGVEGDHQFYICRSPYMNGVHGGKAFPKGTCNFGYGGGEQTASTYEVLTGTNYVWQTVLGPQVTPPAKAVFIGDDGDGTSFYVCRALYQNGVHPGKVLKGYCHISWGGKEQLEPTFEVLVDGGNGATFNPRERHRWVLSAASTDVRYPLSNLVDGDINSRWSSGHSQIGTELVLVDMGASTFINKLVLDTGPMFLTDFPVSQVIEVSPDNISFTTVLQGTGTPVITAIFPPVSARYVRIRQTGNNMNGYWWSASELTITGP